MPRALMIAAAAFPGLLLAAVGTWLHPTGLAVGRLFEIGGLLGDNGVWCLLACAVLTGLALAREVGPRAVPCAVVLAAPCFPFRTGHIFHPVGVLAMLGVAAGCALLAVAVGGSRRRALEGQQEPVGRPA